MWHIICRTPFRVSLFNLILNSIKILIVGLKIKNIQIIKITFVIESFYQSFQWWDSKCHCSQLSIWTRFWSSWRWDWFEDLLTIYPSIIHTTFFQSRRWKSVSKSETKQKSLKHGFRNFVKGILEARLVVAVTWEIYYSKIYFSGTSVLFVDKIFII